jgi:hypothetical protein
VTVDSLFPNKNLREAVNAYKRSMGMEVRDGSTSTNGVGSPPPGHQLPFEDSDTITTGTLALCNHNMIRRVDLTLPLSLALILEGALSRPGSKPATPGPTPTSMTPPQSPPADGQPAAGPGTPATTTEAGGAEQAPAANGGDATTPAAAPAGGAPDDGRRPHDPSHPPPPRDGMPHDNRRVRACCRVLHSSVHDRVLTLVP